MKNIKHEKIFFFFSDLILILEYSDDVKISINNFINININYKKF